MRAPVQKKRPRRTGRQTAPEGAAEQTPVGKGRPTHVRNRLIVAVAVVAAAIAGAGAPSVLAAAGQASDTQDLVTLAGQTQDALALAHALADERDEVTPYIAAGRPKSKAPSEQHSARVDRQVEELRGDTDTPASLLKDLDGIAAVRRAALTGKSTALEAHRAYSDAINELHRLAEELAEQLPPRAGSGAYALAELDSAVQQAAATRGLLLAALSVPSSTQTVIDPVTGLPTTKPTSSESDTRQRAALTAAAQQARLRSDAALEDFRDTATKTARGSYDSTVTGPEVNSAEKYLASLTDQPTLADGELTTDPKKLNAALSARVEAMRGIESALYDRRTKDLERLRDDDVTELEIRIAILGALMLLAVGIATAMARSLTRPLAVLRIGSARLAEAADPSAEEPVKFTGRNDEFARVVRSVNTLHAQAVALHERLATLETDRKHLVGQRQKMADAREQLRAELEESTAQLERVRTSIGGTFVNLALRTLGLVERQLAVIEQLEDREQDPDRLATLFKLDHFATVMRRHSENLLVLAGTEHVQQHPGPVPLVDVVRAAVSEIERYERMRISALPPHAHIAGFAADDLSHLLAELMENATSFTPPDLPVEVSGWLLESGEVMLSVQDEGIGMTEERMERLNARLADFDADAAYDQEGEEGLGLGLYVVARLAHRLGVRVQLREQKQGGVAAVVVLPQSLLADAAPAAVPGASPSPDGTHAFSLPGADAEANSNVLRGRPKTGDPLVALAEQTVREHETAPDAERAERDAESDARSDSEARPESDARSDSQARPESDAGTESHARPDSDVRPDPDVRPTPKPEPTADAEPVADSEVTADPGTDPAPVSDLPSPSETPSETTLELLIPEPTRPEPDAEPVSKLPAQAEPADEESAPARPEPEPEPEPEQESEAAADPYAIGPDAHDRTPDEGEEPLTDKGLPKRTPKITAPAAAPRQRSGGVDAEALRRRLGGFRRGAEAGHRDVQAEIAEQTAQTRTTDVPAPHDRTSAGHVQAEEATGGTVEEASS
ncbi:MULTISPECIES: nitrate- and nitrite sensing domain-containing protein [unclassified Streptomyces]|uniref:nitrate- and nitrite sensing domain-containing protein n=1 Tax=unclassified Streptomyces TaxID=2593676 RepID=UPI0009A0AE03|nr:nitrate- and nitrite sensing domain-containing protein [Streptomyces sp. TSRI0107]